MYLTDVESTNSKPSSEHPTSVARTAATAGEATALPLTIKRGKQTNSWAL